MAKPYVEVLGDWVTKRDSSRRDANLVAFLAVRDDVKAAVETGYPIMTIWKQMYEAKKVPFGYDTFLNYVNRYIRRVKAPASKDVVAQPPANTAGKQKTPEMKSTPRLQTKPPEAIPGFTFNSSPKKEDLL